jgi:hypothetical protein
MQTYSWDRLVSGYYWMFSSHDHTLEEMVQVAGTEVISFGTDIYQTTEQFQTQIFIKVEDAPVITADILEQINNAAFRRFYTVNKDSKFPRHIEGYWRRAEVTPLKDNEPGANVRHYTYTQYEGFPWPVPMEVEGFEVQKFIEKLVDIETDFAKEVRYRGCSECRLTRENLGNAEYEYKGWKWPDGLAHYLRLGVPPSAAFYKFIMGADAVEGLMLPTYNRDEDE